ncbi:FkbM family methyltransferase [Mucilaginibacter pedocola]|uniref:Methyltransferase FkbM domain-containing protein n=1 Tax=Mucilaginibacter pedocola TaxID=1792845 RepID=A0A1S9PB68_9SPHI|nr:FkbM family methyltransferase [Mucilaginibacter pedocola]OOQ58067.1 hypothetical protein BC343_10430 [Mucilaginibacter pedocola]
MLTPLLNSLRHIKGRLFPKNRKATPFVIGNLKLVVGNDLAWAFSSGDYYEKNVIHFLGLLIANYQKPVLVDIGANCGYYSTKYAAACQKVFSFEPVKGTFSLLKRNVRRNNLSNIVPFNLGLSNSPGSLTINIYNSSGNNSIFERVLPEGHPLQKTGTETIRLETLDNLVATGQVLPPDVIKIDVEGAELFVLKGAENTILKHRPAILLEYSENTSTDAGYAKEELLTALALTNYNIYGLPEDETDMRLITESEFQNNGLSNIMLIPAENDPFKKTV